MLLTMLAFSSVHFWLHLILWLSLWYVLWTFCMWVLMLSILCYYTAYTFICVHVPLGIEMVCFWAFNPFASLRRCQFSALLSSHWFSPIAVLNLLKCTVSVPISFCFGIHSVQYFSSCILNSRFLLLSDDLSPSNSEPDSVDRQQNLGRLHVWLFSLSLVSKVHPF